MKHFFLLTFSPKIYILGKNLLRMTMIKKRKKELKKWNSEKNLLRTQQAIFTWLHTFLCNIRVFSRVEAWNNSYYYYFLLTHSTSFSLASHFFSPASSIHTEEEICKKSCKKAFMCNAYIKTEGGKKSFSHVSQAYHTSFKTSAHICMPHKCTCIWYYFFAPPS